MKKKRINLHMEQKRTLMIVLFFAMILSMVGVLAGVTMNTDCAQLSSLLRSGYIYSVTVANSMLENNYYQFDVGINYMRSPDAAKSLNAEILMQSKDSNYTDLLDWNSKALSVYGVAVTEGLAKRNNLKVGDKLYSKHIVDGTVHEYTVEQILPELISARVTSFGGYTRGIIIMGYDKQYLDNISHESIVFTREALEDLTSRALGTPMNLVYRSDEIKTVVMKLLPYFLLFALLAVMIVSSLMFIINKTVKYNFKRFILLGFEDRRLNSAYFRLVSFMGVSSIILAAIISFVYSQMSVFSFVEAATLFILTIIELATLFVSARLSKKQLWR